MDGFFFTVKTLIASFLLLFLLQIKVSGTSVEERAETLIYESAASQTFGSVARGAIQVTKDGWSWVQRMIRDEGSRSSSSSSSGSSRVTSQHRDKHELD